MKFSIKDFSRKCGHADLATFTGDILNGNFIFCAVLTATSTQQNSQIFTIWLLYKVDVDAEFKGHFFINWERRYYESPLPTYAHSCVER